MARVNSFYTVLPATDIGYTNRICFYSPAAEHHRPLSGTVLIVPSHGGMARLS